MISQEIILCEYPRILYLHLQCSPRNIKPARITKAIIDAAVRLEELGLPPQDDEAY